MKNILLLCALAVVWGGCTESNMRNRKDLKKYFDKYQVNGCFGLWNNASNEISVYNRARFVDSAFTPASTYKVVNFLIGLQTGAIETEKTKFKWDGVQRPIEAWNRDLDADSAFKVSAVWFFQEVARRIGRDTMKMYIDSISYGNKNISGPIDSFWLNNTLKIRPDEQLGLMKKLYFRQMPFFDDRFYLALKNAMLMESTDKYSLSYKTGLGYTEQGHPLGWMVGWIETGGSKPKVHFFVLNIESSDPQADLRKVRINLLKDLLAEMELTGDKKPS